MILLLPGFALFLLFGSADGPRAVLQPRVVALAAVDRRHSAALQYVWNFRGLWSLDPPAGTACRTRFGRSGSTSPRRTGATRWSGDRCRRDAARPCSAMYWFDLRQQFGVPGVVAACAGTRPPAGATSRRVRPVHRPAVRGERCCSRSPTTSATRTSSICPSHLVVALLAARRRHGAAGAGGPGDARPAQPALVAVAAACLSGVAARSDDWPAVDRSDDARAHRVLAALTARRRRRARDPRSPT